MPLKTFCVLFCRSISFPTRWGKQVLVLDVLTRLDGNFAHLKGILFESHLGPCDCTIFQVYTWSGLFCTVRTAYTLHTAFSRVPSSWWRATGTGHWSSRANQLSSHNLRSCKGECLPRWTTPSASTVNRTRAIFLHEGLLVCIVPCLWTLFPVVTLLYWCNPLQRFWTSTSYVSCQLGPFAGYTRVRGPNTGD